MTSKLGSDLIQKKPGTTDYANFPNKLEENDLNRKLRFPRFDIDNDIRSSVDASTACEESLP
jgi:hypothetical protein